MAVESGDDVGSEDCEANTAGGAVVTVTMGALELALRVDARVAGGSDAIASKNDFFFFFASGIVVVCE